MGLASFSFLTPCVWLWLCLFIVYYFVLLCTQGSRKMYYLLTQNQIQIRPKISDGICCGQNGGTSTTFEFKLRHTRGASWCNRTPRHSRMQVSEECRQVCNWLHDFVLHVNADALISVLLHERYCNPGFFVLAYYGIIRPTIQLQVLNGLNPLGWGEALDRFRWGGVWQTPTLSKCISKFQEAISTIT